MAKYTVILEAKYMTEVVVEAKSEDAALKKAEKIADKLAEEQPYQINFADTDFQMVDGEPIYPVMAFPA